MAQALEHENARALAHDKTTAARVKRDRGRFRVVAGVQRLHVLKARDSDTDNGSFGAAREDNVLIAMTDGANRLADRMVTSCASGNRAEALALKAKAHGDMRGSHIADHLRDAQRADTSRPLGQHTLHFVFKHSQAADARTHHHAHAVRVKAAFFEAALLDCFLRGDQRKMAETIHALGLALINILGRIEIFDLSCDLDFEIRGVEGSNRRNTALARLQRFPETFYVMSNRSDRAHAGNNNSFHDPPSLN